MMKLQWGQPLQPIVVQWGRLASDTEIASREHTPDPVPIMIATGSSTPVNWTVRQW